MEITNLNELMTFLEGIPEENWTVDTVDDGKNRHCVAGHINIHLHGDPQYRFPAIHIRNGTAGIIVDALIGPNGFNELVDVNNGQVCYSRGSITKGKILSYGKAPKERVINYLNEKINERSQGIEALPL